MSRQEELDRLKSDHSKVKRMLQQLRMGSTPAEAHMSLALKNCLLGEGTRLSKKIARKALHAESRASVGRGAAAPPADEPPTVPWWQSPHAHLVGDSGEQGERWVKRLAAIFGLPAAVIEAASSSSYADGPAPAFVNRLLKHLCASNQAAREASARRTAQLRRSSASQPALRVEAAGIAPSLAANLSTVRLLQTPPGTSSQRADTRGGFVMVEEEELCSICLEPLLKQPFPLAAGGQSSRERRADTMKGGRRPTTGGKPRGGVGGGEATCLPGCGHLFHAPCIRAWLSRSAACPLCKGDVRQAAQDAAATRSGSGGAMVRGGLGQANAGAIVSLSRLRSALATQARAAKTAKAAKTGGGSERSGSRSRSRGLQQGAYRVGAGGEAEKAARAARRRRKAKLQRLLDEDNVVGSLRRERQAKRQGSVAGSHMLSQLNTIKKHSRGVNGHQQLA